MNEKRDSLEIDRFVSAVQAKLNWHWAGRVALWTSIAASLVLFVIALFYLVPGFRLPAFWYLIVLGVAVLVSVPVWFFRRSDRTSAAHFADDYFHLKDSVCSHVHFAEAKKAGGFYDLQAKQTNEAVAKVSAKQIRLRHPYRLSTVAVVCLAVAISLGFKTPSQTVLDRLAKEAATLAMTETVKKQMQQLIDELDASLDDETEKALIDPEKLRKWVDELEQTKDHKEALRQYAQLERKFNKAAMKLQQRREEQLLNQAAKELKKDEQLQDLAEKLKQKNYEKAASELEKMKSEKFKSDKKLSQMRKDLAKLKAAANRMAQAAKEAKRNRAEAAQAANRQNGNLQTQQKNNGAQNGGARGKVGEQKNAADGEAGNQANGEEQDGEEADDQLEQLLEELDEAAEEFDNELQRLEEMDPSDQSEDDLQQCEECQGRLGGKLDQLGKKLRRMAKKRSAQSKLKKLSQKSTQIQAGIMQVQQKGGKQPGVGESDASRDQKDPLKDNGMYSKLKGIKGNGQSLTKIESAEEGSGVSSRRSEAKQRDYQKQFESFVDREDVPEELKAGVKNYFIQIHQGGVLENEPEGSGRQ